MKGLAIIVPIIALAILISPAPDSMKKEAFIASQENPSLGKLYSEFSESGNLSVGKAAFIDLCSRISDCIREIK